MNSALLVSIVLNLFACIQGFPNGAPNCKVTVPKHSKDPQTSDQPYEIHAIQTTDNNFLIEIGHENATELFRGFVVMQKNPDHAQSGHWVIPEEFRESVKILESLDESTGEFHQCGVTHSNNLDKGVVRVRFEAKEEFEELEDPEFMAIMVQSFGVFWVDIPVTVAEVHLTDDQ
ncbi:uncharacterized protein LOC131884652 [Tigriopus californicus]|uniref:uncharacterized protein LOC131884652 n=1 Tax=Tigriopus californicus TaxID=6832 RepID=UPI0027D9EC3A|nr:uncharacterized protein LOC131884652 [Tigriopus californicus]